MKKLLHISFFLVSFNAALLPIVPNFSNSRERNALAAALVADSSAEFAKLIEESAKEAKSSANWSKAWGVFSFLHGNIPGLVNYIKNAVVEGKRVRRNEALQEKAKEVFALLQQPDFQEKWGVDDWADSAERVKRAESWGLASQWLSLIALVAAMKAFFHTRSHTGRALVTLAFFSPYWFKSLVTRFVRAMDKAPDMDAVYDDALEELAEQRAE